MDKQIENIAKILTIPFGLTVYIFDMHSVLSTCADSKFRNGFSRENLAYAIAISRRENRAGFFSGANGDNYCVIPLRRGDQIRFLLLKSEPSLKSNHANMHNPQNDTDIASKKKLVLATQTCYFLFYDSKMPIDFILHIKQYEMLAGSLKNDMPPESDEINMVRDGYELMRKKLESIKNGSCNDKYTDIDESEFSQLLIEHIGYDLEYGKSMYISTITLLMQEAVYAEVDAEMITTLNRYYFNKTHEIKSAVDAVNLMAEAFNMFGDLILDAMTEKVDDIYIVKMCKKYINQHIYQDIQISEIAKKLQVSEAHVARMFKKSTGLTLTGYARKMKIKKAVLLLKNTSMPLVEISDRLAFCTQSHFTATFKKEMAATPGEYRKNIQDGIALSVQAK